jgi:hypothetical protein
MRLTLPVAAIAIALFGGSLCLSLSVLGQRTPYIIALFDAALRISANEALVALVRLYQFSRH